MESNFLTAVFLPSALFIIMLGMGLSLTWADFKRVVIAPKAVLIGLAAQLVMLPVVGIVLASVLPLSPELAIGVVILSACPGGPTSNLLTFLAKGDIALSITLTAISSVVTVASIPIVINLAMNLFGVAGQSVQLPILQTIIQICVVTIIPVSLGMLLKQKAPGLAASANKPVKFLSIFFLTLIIVGVLLKERENVLSFIQQVGLVTLSLNLVTMALGYGLAQVARLQSSQKTAIAIEVGLQNGTLAIAIASSPLLLNNSTMAIPAAIYSLLMFVTGGIFAYWRGSQAPELLPISESLKE